MRRLLYGASSLLILAALLLVPLPLFVISPGLAVPISGTEDSPGVITIGGDTDPVSGALMLTAVQVGRAPAVSTLMAVLDPDEDVVTGVVPPGVDTEEFARIQRRLFQESIRVAAAVGLRAAGHDVTVTGGGARVLRVIPGSPADEFLQQGDVIVEAAGQTVELASELAAITARQEPGSELPLTVVRGDERLEVSVLVRPLPGTSRPGLGVLVETIERRIELPVPVEASEGIAIGGPSAGLMFALTVYDLTDPADLTRGRRIAGTGTIDLTGRVGEISGVRAKVVAAADAGAEIFLAPAGQAEEARRAAPAGMRVVGVRSLDEAITELSSS